MLIGVSGKAGSGKDTFASILISAMPNFENRKFSKKLKIVCALMLGCDPEDFEIQEFKSAPILVPKYRNKGINTNRDLALYVGMAMRDANEDAWVDALFVDYKPYADRWDADGITTVAVHPDWVVTDVRFPNEAEAIKQRGGKLVRIERPGAGVDHISDTALDDYGDWDFIINNDSNLREYETKIYKTIHKLCSTK